LPESSFNVAAANFVPSGVIIPADVKVTSAEKVVEKEEKKEDSKQPAFNFNATSFVPSATSVNEPAAKLSESSSNTTQSNKQGL